MADAVIASGASVGRASSAPEVLVGAGRRPLPAASMAELVRVVVDQHTDLPGTFELTFEVNQPGRYGYTLGAGLNEEWIGIEFQLKTT